MSDLHTNAPDPTGYSIHYRYDDDHEPVALVVTRLADDTVIGEAASREEVDELVGKDIAS